MREAPRESPDLSPASLHFQILAAGTVIFLAALFWFTALPHTNTYEQLAAAALPRLVLGIQLLGCYLAFVGVVLGHGVLNSGKGRSSGENNKQPEES